MSHILVSSFLRSSYNLLSILVFLGELAANCSRSRQFEVLGRGPTEDVQVHRRHGGSCTGSSGLSLPLVVQHFID